MNFSEKIIQKEQIKSPREKLLELEKTGKFVFHGSPHNIDVLEPHQGYDLDEKTARMEKDGEPAVFATPYADIAIFRALINNSNNFRDSTSEFGINDKKLSFSATKNLLEAAAKKTGKVYILDKENFEHFEEMQCRSGKKIIPIEVIEVSAKDLPGNIKIIE